MEKQTINLTPTWSQVATIIQWGFRIGNDTAIKLAKQSLLQMSKLADEYVKQHKSGIFEENVIHFAQIAIKELLPPLRTYFRQHTSFKDTDEELNEFIMPVSVLNESVEYFERWKDKNYYEQAFHLWFSYKDKNIQYIHFIAS